MPLSRVVPIAQNVPFPPFRGQQVYMVPFKKADGLPPKLRRWQPTIDAMLKNVSTKGTIYLTVDQRLIPAGETHRRPGVHTDGYWTVSAGHDPHNGEGTHVGIAPVQRHRQSNETGHRTAKGDHRHRIEALPTDHQALILASDVCASEAYVGAFEGVPGEGGDCSHLSLSRLATIPLLGKVAWAGDTMTMIHASTKVDRPTRRTLVRLNVNGWLPD